MTSTGRVAAAIQKDDTDDNGVIRAKNMEEAMEKLSARAKRKIYKVFQASPHFQHSFEALENLPKFSFTELDLGKMLGKGQFGTVHEIMSFNLDARYDSEDDDDEKPKHSGKKGDGDTRTDGTKRESSSGKGVRFSNNSVNSGRQFPISTRCVQETSSRDFLSSHAIRDDGSGHARYAMKMLQERHYKNPTRFYQGAKDLALEAHFLSSIEHPNIIKMRGTAIDKDSCGKHNFLILDRLYNTLEKQKQTWKERNDKFGGVKGIFLDFKKESRNELLDERLTVAFDLASALTYLHKVHILHRDLKPDNIGFDVRGDVKIFDFGLAKELPSGQPRPYALTGNTGSMRYMAPEVYGCERYDERADVHSFGVLLWELMALEKPFDGYNVDGFKEDVFVLGIRPKVQKQWSQEIRDLMESCYHRNFGSRPFMFDVREALKRELAKVRMQDVSEIEKEAARRRSTHVFPKK
jgi:serine/threonine protein kinase